MIQLVAAEHSYPSLVPALRGIKAQDDFDVLAYESVTLEEFEEIVADQERRLEELLTDADDSEKVDRLRENRKQQKETWRRWTEAPTEVGINNVLYLDGGRTQYFIEGLEETAHYTISLFETFGEAIGEADVSDDAALGAIVMSYLQPEDASWRSFFLEEPDTSIGATVENLSYVAEEEFDKELGEETLEEIRDIVENQYASWTDVRKDFVESIVETEFHQNRERYWIEQLERHEGEIDDAIYMVVGPAHAADEGDNFYSKLQTAGYDVRRSSIDEFLNNQ